MDTKLNFMFNMELAKTFHYFFKKLLIMKNFLIQK